MFEGIPSQTMKAYRGHRNIAPLNLKIETVGDELLTGHFGRIRTKKRHLYPLNRLDGSQSQFGSFKRDKRLLPSTVQPLCIAKYCPALMYCQVLSSPYVLPSTVQPLCIYKYCPALMYCQVLSSPYVLPSIVQPLCIAKFCPALMYCQVLSSPYVFPSSVQPLTQSLNRMHYLDPRRLTVE